MDETSELKLYELYYIVTAYMLHDDVDLPCDLSLIWPIINSFYAKENGVSLDITKETNQNKLYNWLANKSRYQLLDELMLHMYRALTTNEDNSKIDNTDFFFVNNLYAMEHVMESYHDEIAPILYNTDHKKISTVSKKETISIVKDILTEIDPNEEWLSMYEDLLKKNHIIYLNELSTEEKNKLINKLGIKSLKEIENACLYIDNKEPYYIFLNYTNTISDIPTTIHEVIHYIVKKTNFGSRELPILREFSSILFELYSLDYLKRLGYGNSELKTINHARLMDSFNMYDDIKDIMYYLIMLIENGKITEKQDLKITNKKLNRIKRIFNREEMKAFLCENPNEFDAKTRCNQRCDNVIHNLIINPYILFDSYPYIIGSYLADMGMKKIATSHTTLSLMKYITEKISKLDAYDIFSILESPITNIIPTIYSDTNNLNKRKARIKR